MNELEKKIENLISKLRIGNEYKDYDTLEFDLLDYCVWISEQEFWYNKEKLQHEAEYTNKFNEMREANKSDASTDRNVEQVLKVEIFDMKTKKSEIDKLDKKYKWYIRISNHINSRFIKWMADEKRQRMVETREELPF